MRMISVQRTLLVIVAGALFLFLGCGPVGNNRSGNNAGAPDTKSNEVGGPKVASSTCSAADDKQIVSQIRVMIDDDPALGPHRKHINYSTKYCKVTLRGWVDTWENFQKLYDKINNAGGVRSIDVKHFELRAAAPAPADQCPAGTKPCGELCIPIDVDCTIQITQ